ncbi:MAG: PDDEXK nuclease domain-containing protein [Paludibacteraceae bacterium]|nr:PDDEXK nuclease domain-containing protein [Paludibacteraceae bacterium]
MNSEKQHIKKSETYGEILQSSVAVLPAEQQLFSDLCSIINEARRHVATYVNTEACLMNWHVGKRIKDDVLFGKRAEYGKQILAKLAKQLTEQFGAGWSEKNLRHCLRAAETFSEDEIVSASRRQLSWTHIKTLMYLKDDLERKFYMEMCRIEHWDTRTLAEKIDGQLFQRTAISQRPEEVIRRELTNLEETNVLHPDIVFRSAYILDMLGLPDAYSEKDLEDSILNCMVEFIHELGSDFTFVDRQRRITVDSEDYYIDLLFYHRGLRRLVAIDLKLGKFKPAYEGQMRLYLRYLNANDRKEWEEEPIGLILCSEGNTEHIQYLMMDEKSDIRVAQYYTELPDKQLLADKLQRAIAIAREKQQERDNEET